MKTWGWGTFAFAAALLACAFAAGAQESVIYSFQSSSDGQSPNGGPAVDKNGNLYGTTATGGAHGSGIVYELSPPSQPSGDWTETVIYNFGDVPAAGGSPGISGQGGTVILDDNGNLYGTANGGVSNISGKLASGVVYELSPPVSGSGEWTAQALYTFIPVASTDLKGPNGAVIFDSNGNLYGIAYGGGAYSDGGVFELSPPVQQGAEWTMTPLYSYHNDFSNSTGLPWEPGANASLIVDGKGNLYGTTQSGGAANSGTVYELSPPSGGGSGSWTPAILHSFKENAPHDGYGPLGSLVMDAQGNLYGTTGAQGLYAGGIVFELSPPASAGDQWTETVLDNFHGFSTTDGYQPNANVVFDSQGDLWGTTYWGGPNGDGDGAIFELIPQTGGGWAEAWQVPYLFGSHAGDAFHPYNPIVIDGKDNIYSADTGGATVCNKTSTCGAVWEYTPPPPAATPTFNPPAGRYTSTQTVAINDGTTGATIYYTTDGTEPSTLSSQYSSAIKVSASETVRAIAVATGYAQSSTTSAAYVIETAAAMPFISPTAGVYVTNAWVRITDSTPGAAIYYTTNGQTPTTASTKYGAEFKLTESAVVKAIAVAPNYTQSATAAVAYTIRSAAPTFSVKPGKYTATQSVKIMDATPGVAIYYTIDGTTPTSKSTRYITNTVIVVKSNETIKAMAIAKGAMESAIAVAVYTFPAATPVIKPNGGKVKSGSSITITDTTKAAVIYYTTNGLTPTANSTRYVNGIVVKSNETIKAIAIAPKYTESAIASAKFTLE